MLGSTIFILVVCFIARIHAAKPQTTVVAFWCKTGTFAGFYDGFLSKQWKTWLEAKTSNPNWPVNVTVEVVDTGSNNTYMRHYAATRVANKNLPPVSVFIFNSQVIEDILYFEQFDIPCIVDLYTANVFTQNLDQGSQWNNTFMIQPAPQYLFTDLVPLYKSKGIKTFAMVIDNSDGGADPALGTYSYSQDLCRNSARDLFIPNGFTLLESITYNINTVTVQEYENYVNTLDKLQPDAVILCTLGNLWRPDKPWIVQTMKELSYLPKAVNVAGLDGWYIAAIFNSLGLLDYMTQATPTHRDLAGVDYTERNTPYSSYFAADKPITVADSLLAGSNIGHHSSSARSFADWFKSIFGQGPSVYSTINWAAFDVVEAAIYQVAINPDLIVDGYIKPLHVKQFIAQSNLPTPLGRVIFNEYRVNTATPAVIIQWLNNDLNTKIVAPSSLSSHEFVYPMPTWDERVYNWSLTKGNAPKAVGVAIGCSVLILLIMVTITVFREQMDIRMLNHLHLSAMLFCILVIVWGLAYVWQGDVNQAQCNALLWTIYLPASFIIQLVNMKAYRLSVFLTSDNKKRTNKLSHNRILMLALGWTSFTAVLLLIAQFVDPPTKTTIVVDIYRPSTNYNICRYHNTTTGILAFLFALHLLMAMLCVIVVRNGSEAFKDGLIMKESFILLFGGIIIAYIFNELGLDAQTEYFLRTIFVGLGFTLFAFRLLASRCLKHWIPTFVAIRLVASYNVVQKYMPSSTTFDSKVHSSMASLEDEKDAENKWLREKVAGTTTDQNVKDMDKVFEDEKRFQIFKDVCKKLHIEENVDFLSEVYHYPMNYQKAVQASSVDLTQPVMKVIDTIRKKYCVDDAEKEVNISYEARTAMKSAFENRVSAPMQLISEKIANLIYTEDLLEVKDFFETASKEVKHMLYQNAWNKFIAEETNIRMATTS